MTSSLPPLPPQPPTMNRTMSGLNSLESIRDAMESTDTAERPEFSRILAYGMWDQPEQVLQAKGKPVGSGKLLQQFFSKLEAIEERYAKDLYALASTWPVSRFVEGPALFSAFAKYVVMTRQRAELHGKQSELLKRVSQGKTLEASDSMLEKPCKEVASQIKDSSKQLKKTQEQLQSAVKAMQKFEESATKKLSVHDKPNWRAHLSEKNQKKLHDVEKQLHEAEVAHAMVTEVHNQCVGRGLDSVQALEYRRVSTLLHAVYSSVDHLAKMTAVQWKAATQSMRQLKHVNWDTDLKKWVDQHTSHVPCPFAPVSINTVGSRASIATNATATVSSNPFSRRSQLRLATSRFSEQRQRNESFAQAQAQKDAAKFVKLLKLRQKKEQKLKLRAQRNENEALREEQKLQTAAQADLEQRIREVTEEKTREVSAKEALLQQLMAEKEAADREREELRLLLQEKEQELKTKGAGMGASAAKQAAADDDDDDDEEEEVDLKRPIILDNGLGYVKIGFSGQRAPTFVVPNVCAHLPHPLATSDDKFEDHPLSVYGSTAQHLAAAYSGDDDIRVNAQVFSDQPTNWSDVQRMYEYLFQQMGVDPREHPFLLTQPSMAPHSLKERMVELFFQTFQVPALYVATAPVLSAYAYGSASGLVVDVGHSSCQVVPLIDGYLLEPHVQRALHLGGQKDTTRIANFLQEQVVLRAKAADSYSGARVIDASIKSLVTATSIKDRLAVCTTSTDNYVNMMDILQAVQGFAGHPDADPDAAAADDDGGGGGHGVVEEYRDDAQAVPMALQQEMLKCGEVMFRPRELLDDHDASIVSIPEMIVNVVRRCDLDTRRTLLSNVFLSGGVPTMPGFRQRLDAELRFLMPQANDYLSIQDSEAQYAAWVGGSVLSGLVEFQEQWVFLEEWEEARDVFDNQEPRFTLEDMRKENLLVGDDGGGDDED